MKQFPMILLVPVVFFAMLLVYTKVAGPLPLSVSSVVTQKSDTFTVTAEGKSSQVPDTVHASLGVQSSGNSVKEAQDDLNRKMKAITDSVKKLGVEDKDIQTNNYSISPNYDWSNGRQRIIGYNANSNLSVKIRKADMANDVIDAATAAGANNVGGITFEVSDKEGAQNEAREKAVAEAKKKAETAARIAGFRLGKIVNYYETFGGQEVYPMPMSARLENAAIDSKVATPQLELGSQDIIVNVTLSYEIQ